MRLRELHIKNFRKIQDLTIIFPPGLAVIVGENNSGKTAIIDALRLMLFSSRDFDALRLNEDDFRTGTDYSPIEISCIFCDAKDEDEVHFQECLVDVGDGKFDIRLNARVQFNKTTRRASVKMWGGETEGGSLPSTIYDHLTSVYLQPLRDPESGLKPSRNSQIAKLLDRVTKEEERTQFETIAKEANERIRDLEPVTSARNDINTQMLSIAGEELTQQTDLIFADPTFHRIIANLQPEIDGLPFSLNGLGYNNLIFTSATLGTLRRSSQFSFRSILVEEPEAHLHPQLQVLLLKYFATVVDEDAGNEVQVIASSHSPILASQAPIDSIVCVQEKADEVRAVSVCTIEFDEQMKKKLQRFLDATRGELFFARRILMVEGIAEVLLLPVLAKIAGGDLKKSAVTLVNADGLNFNCFLPLFGTDRINAPVAILTDGDAETIGDPCSATAAELKAKEPEIPNLRVERSEITFEHELARSPLMLPLMLDAFEALHPNVGASLRTNIGTLSGDDDKADLFFSQFKTSQKSKGIFAQELAALLDAANLEATAVPEYIQRAFEFLGVVTVEGNNEQSGEPSPTDSGPVSD
jgi:putative ATP-dependent endonuclease of the OLD family